MSVTSLLLPATRHGITERLLLLAPFCLLWSAAFTAAKIGLTDSPPLLLLAIRFLIAGLLLSGFVLWRRGRQAFDRHDLGRLAVLGIANHALYLSLGYLGMTTISSGLAAVIVSTNPILTALLASFLLGERFSATKALGLILGLAGVIVILRSRVVFGHDDLTGMLFSIGAAVGLAAGTILYKRLPTRSDAFAGLSIQLLAAGLGLLPIALMLEDAGQMTLSWALLGALGFLVGPVSIGAYALWFALLQHGSASHASSLHFLMPPLGLLMGHMVLGEPLNLIDFLGILPIALGIWLVTRSR